MNKYLFVLALLIGLISLACSATTPAKLAAQPTRPPTTTPSKTAAGPPTQSAGVACVVTAQALHVRSCAGVACPVTGWLMIGKAVNIAGITTGWALLSSGGYVNSNFLTCEKGQ